jgi:DNA-binding FrmR family transcriptional regulator
MGADKQEVLNRFHALERHLDVIRELIEEGQPCLDVLRQTYAMRKATEQLEAVLGEHRYATCIREGISSEWEETIITELVQLYHLVGNR